MLVYRQLGMVEEPFKVLNYRVIEDKTPQGVSVSQATVKLQVGDKISHQVSEGDGPVNALDAALRKALLPFFPNMAKVKLDDYKVRVLGSNVASDATVRVWTTFGDEKGYWNVVGVSSKIIEASWMAFVDGLTYKILVDNKVIDCAYKHIDVKSVAAAGQASAVKEEEPAPAKAKKLSARKVRNLADITRSAKKRK
jgi:2-isopropylmalate synthase